MASPGFTRLQAYSEQFRDCSNEVATDARYVGDDLARDLDRPLGSSPDWCTADEADLDALSTLSELERGFDTLLRAVPYDSIQANEDQGADAEVSKFISLRDTFHTALPFSEAERGWLLKAYRGEFEPMRGNLEAFKVIGNQEARIVAAGVRQLVSGRELVRRWLAWRRETDEYAGQDTLGLARVTLGEIVTLTAVK